MFLKTIIVNKIKWKRYKDYSSINKRSNVVCIGYWCVTAGSYLTIIWNLFNYNNNKMEDVIHHSAAVCPQNIMKP